MESQWNHGNPQFDQFLYESHATIKCVRFSKALPLLGCTMGAGWQHCICDTSRWSKWLHLGSYGSDMFWSSVTYTLRQTRLRSVSKLLLCVVPLPFCSHPFFAPWPQITLMWNISSAMRTPSANAYKVGQQAQSEMESLKRQAIGRSWDVLGSNWHRKFELLWVWNIDAQQHDHLAIWDCFFSILRNQASRQTSECFFFHDGTSLPLLAVANLPPVHKSLKEALICLNSTLQAFLKVMRVCMVEFVLCIV